MCQQRQIKKATLNSTKIRTKPYAEPYTTTHRTRLNYALSQTLHKAAPNPTQQRTKPYTKQRSSPPPCRVLWLQCRVLCIVCAGFETQTIHSVTHDKSAKCRVLCIVCIVFCFPFYLRYGAGRAAFSRLGVTSSQPNVVSFTVVAERSSASTIASRSASAGWEE